MLRILSGQWKGHSLSALHAAATRPTTSQLRQAIFNIWSGRLEGASFLDVFAGSGAMGLEALSLGAVSSHFVESHPQAIKVILQNIERLDCRDRARLHQQTVEIYIKKSSVCFDLIFVDPPYDWALGSSKGHYVMDLARLLSSRLNPLGELIIEQDRHCREALLPIESLKLVETRTYGDTLLHRFAKI